MEDVVLVKWGCKAQKVPLVQDKFHEKEHWTVFQIKTEDCIYPATEH